MTRYFFGHHKCATNWMRRYAKDLSERFGWRLEMLNGGPPVCENPDGQEIFRFYWNTWWNEAASIEEGDRAVHLIRDPRDALVSGYWSWKTSHQQNNRRILEVREQLNQCSLEEGLLIMIDHVTSLEQLEGWEFDHHPNILTIRYEDLLENTSAVVTRFLEHWQIALEPTEINALIERHSFQAITGRQRGEEKTNHHFRKGSAGDWKSYFTEAVTPRFKEKHGAMLIKLGYESSDDW